MDNDSLANAFKNIADLLEIKGENRFKVLAYRRAAESIKLQSTDLANLDLQSLKEIPAIGQAIAEKIQEFNRTGKLEFLEKLEREVPPSLIEILNIQDVGPKRAALFWKEADVTNLQQLEKAAREGKLRNLPGMGEKIENRILESIKLYQQEHKSFNISEVKEIADEWLEYLQKSKKADRLQVAGSLRRWKPQIGDVDLVASSSKPAELMQIFLKHPKVERILSEETHKSSIVIENGLHIQLWIQPTDRFGSLLQFVTGSKEHNVKLRELAQKRGFSLSEKGFIKTDNLVEILCTEESQVYQHLQIPWIPPEMREDRGEIQAAIESKLPQLVERSHIIADLHMHSDWSDGHHSLEQLTRAAIQNGLEILALTDHSPKRKKLGALDEERILQRKVELERIQKIVGDQIHLLQGVEVDILPDGSLDFADEVLADMDVVVASLHEDLNQSKDQITARLIAAIRNPHVDIIGHPNGKEEGKHPGTDANWDDVFKEAFQNKTSLEINSHPCHFELDEFRARQAARDGVMISINTDTHRLDEFMNIQFGIGIARRAWLQRDNVINAWTKEQIFNWLQRS